MNHIKNIYIVFLIGLFFGSCTEERIGFDELYSTNGTAIQVTADQKLLEFTSDKQFAEVRFAANFWWDAEIQIEHITNEYDTGNWFSMSPVHNFGNRPVRISMTRNIEKVDRNIKLTFKSEGTFVRDLTITQKASKPLIELSSTFRDCGLIGANFNLKMTSTEKWKVTKPDWCDVKNAVTHSTITSGTKCRDSELAVTVQINSTGADRKGDIVFVSEEDASITTKLTIDQAGVYEAPQNLSITNGDKLLLTFDKVRGAMFYVVELYKQGETASYASYQFAADNTSQLNPILDLSQDSILTKIKASNYFGLTDISVSGYVTPTAFKTSKPLQNVSMLFADNSGDGTTETPFLIKNVRHFMNVGNVLTANFKQLNDIDLSAVNFYPIGRKLSGVLVTTSPFSGIYDGNGHQISNVSLTISSANDLVYGLFSQVTGEVKNLTLVKNSFTLGTTPKVTAANQYKYGQLVGHLYKGKLTNCTTQDGTMTLNVDPGGNVAVDIMLGGLVGLNDGGIIDGCVAKNGTITNNTANGQYFSMGGIVGRNGVPISTGAIASEVKNCKNDGTNISSVRTDRLQIVGGVAGSCFSIISNCTNTGNLSTPGYIGGITAGTKPGINPTGYSSTGSWADKTFIENCRNYGTLTFIPMNNVGNVGGIIGYLYCSKVDAKVQNSYNAGKINIVYPNITYDRSNYIGGIVGFMNVGKIANCYNIGAIFYDMANKNFSIQYVAGILGFMNNATGVVQTSYNVGNLTATNDSYSKVQTRGIIGGDKISTNCFSVGSGTPNIGDGTFLTSDQMKDAANFSNWDFSSIWTLNSGINSGYPILQTINYGTALFVKKK